MLLEGLIPCQELVQAPLAISIEQQNTSTEPCKNLYHFAAQLAQQQNLLSISILLGFPYADVYEMGTSFIVISDNNEKAGIEAGIKLLNRANEKLKTFVGYKQNIKSYLNTIILSPKPILLLDMGDNVGGGSTGDSTYLLDVLEDAGIHRLFICIYDPEAVQKSIKHDIGDSFNLSFGYSYCKQLTRQYSSQVTLLNVMDGIFKEKLPRHGGQVNYDMGKSVLLFTKKGSTVMMISKRIAPFSAAQLTENGIDPSLFDIVIAKGVNAPIAAYSQFCPTILKVDTPGVTQADMTLFNYKNRRKPLFPFEFSAE